MAVDELLGLRAAPVLAGRPATSKKLMFSIIPSIGTFSWRNIVMARVASSSATSCGVQTTTAPVSGRLWASVSGTSPVPGGRSITR